jgi:S1-C subfamily serine protease
MIAPPLIKINTTERPDWASRYRDIPLAPHGGQPHQNFSITRSDLRRAVVPVFMLRNDGALEGIGTAFHIDRRGTLLTAYHVIDDGTIRNFADKSHVAQSSESQPYVLFGGFSGYGRFVTPEGTVARIGLIHSKMKRSDSPLAVLQQRDAENAADIAILKTEKPPIPSYVDSFPMRFSGTQPCIGDTVIAIGFPHISTSTTSEGLHELSKLDMQAGYGKIIDIHPSGRTKTNPTPVLEVGHERRSSL